MTTTTLETDHGRFVCAEEGGGTEGTVVDGRPQGLATGTREAAGAWETFTVEHDGEVCYLVSCGDDGPRHRRRPTAARKRKARSGSSSSTARPAAPGKP